MQTKHKIDYSDAMHIADSLLVLLAPACERVEIAGSLRRHRPQIGDIEIVAVPRYNVVYNLFGEPIQQDSLVNDILSQLQFKTIKSGPRFKQFEYQGIKVDLFLANETNWGVILALRTGSADFSHWLVTPQVQGGAMPAGMQCQGGYLRRHGKTLTTLEEQDLFAHLGLEWISPLEREVGLWNRL
ncbi:MAG: hypothetical protein D6706_18435 [Chloroflexi bacterium]|nr:MAG: hypothetical protein D6706_18435 [Chloroflexota bacterium]